MQNTALLQKHLDANAKMVDFAGFNMPVSYEGIKAEHKTVREHVGVFDVSHMGEFILKGTNALQLIQYITTNDASKLHDGKVQYTCMPNGKNGIVDDLLVYRRSQESYYLVVNASNIAKDLSWIEEHNQTQKFGVEIENISDRVSLLAVQGPKALETMQKLTQLDLATMPYYTFLRGTVAGINDVMISTTGYTGAGGFEIYVSNKDAADMWDKIFEAGQAFGIKPIGLGARDTLRLEMGFCLYGHDIDDTTSPLEAGLGWITKLSKDSPFIDQDAMLDLKKEGIKRKLVAFEMIDKGIPRQYYPIVDANNETIGSVTSGSESPTTGKLIGMGYVQTAFEKPETEIFVAIRGKSMKAKVVKLPFINS